MNPTTAAQGISTAQSLGSAALNLVVVLALIFALAWIVRRLRGRVTTTQGPLRVKATLALSMKERVVLVDAAGEHLLLGVSPAGISCLHTYKEPLPETPEPENQFANLLRRVAHAKDRTHAR